jgi:glutamine synthetase type III
MLKLGVAKLPEIEQDNTDRNRTSPFAFTGASSSSAPWGRRRASPSR